MTGISAAANKGIFDDPRLNIAMRNKQYDEEVFNETGYVFFDDPELARIAAPEQVKFTAISAAVNTGILLAWAAPSLAVSALASGRFISLQFTAGSLVGLASNRMTPAGIRISQFIEGARSGLEKGDLQSTAINGVAKAIGGRRGAYITIGYAGIKVVKKVIEEIIGSEKNSGSKTLKEVAFDACFTVPQSTKIRKLIPVRVHSLANTSKTISSSEPKLLGSASQPSHILPRVSRPKVVTRPLLNIQCEQQSSIVLVNTQNSWINVDDIAESLVDTVAEITGISSNLAQAKMLKDVFVNIISTPENAPRLLINQLIQEPERMLQKIIRAPNEFLTNGNMCFADPTFGNALSAASSLLGTLALANQVFPLVTKIAHEGFRKPLAIPLIISKELLQMSTAKIVGGIKLVKGLITHPFKTIEQMFKGIVRSPKQFLTNTTSLFGLGGRKFRKIERKAKKLDRQKEAVQRGVQIAMERELQAIMRIFPECYKIAQQQWMVSESQTEGDYSHALISDWNLAGAQGRFTGCYSQFLQDIEFKLKVGLFSEAAALSPNAHFHGPVVPAYLWHGLAEYSQSNLAVACQAKSFGRVEAKLQATTTELSRAIELAVFIPKGSCSTGIVAHNVSLTGDVDCKQEAFEFSKQREEWKQKTPALGALFKSKMTPAQAEKIRANLAKGKMLSQ